MEKDVLIIFEEKVTLSELTERERQAYERGLDQSRQLNWLDRIGIIGFLLVFFMLGTFVGIAIAKHFLKL